MDHRQGFPITRNANRPRPAQRLLLRGSAGLLILVALLSVQAGGAPVRKESPQARVQAVLSKLPLYFIENRGQVEAPVAYYVQGRDTALYFTAEGVTFVLTKPQSSRPGSLPQGEKELLQPVALRAEPPQTEEPRRWVLKLDFVGANPHVVPQGQDLTPAVISYFKGSPEQWQTGLPTYRSVVYPELWLGIDLVYSGTGSQLKYTFVVKPGADPKQIKLRYRGATALTVADSGQLRVSTPLGGLSDDKPYAYQEAEGKRMEIAAAYAVETTTVADTHVYGFQVGPYDPSKELLLDPVLLVYAGYIGGVGEDGGTGIAVDSAGNAYVTGGTNSVETSFPVTVGPDLTFNNTGSLSADAFVAKVKADGTGLVYAGYIGGSGSDVGLGIAIDYSGNAYITGWTGPTDANFPLTVGPSLTFKGVTDAFVAKVNAAGTGLIYAGYIGGNGFDFGFDIAVDDAGSAYVTGYTASSEATFPVIGGPGLTYSGRSDTFVAKVNAAGTALLYAGYIGGDAEDVGSQGSHIAVDDAGNAYVVGTTSSTEDTFPTTIGPDLTYNGGGDVFVAKVGMADTSLETSVLPVSRSVPVGSSATAFASIINAGTATALGCRIAPRTGLPATFLYQTTDCATNLLTGTLNTPVDIPVGGTACFLFAFTPSSPIAPINVALDFRCTNTALAPTYPRVNTFLFSASTTPTPDIIASGLPCLSDDAPISAVNLPGPNGDNAVGFATTNVGVEGDITVTVDTGSVSLPIYLALCQTNPQTGACINPLIPAPTVMLTMGAGAQPTFSIFALGHGDVPIDMAKNRIFLTFHEGTSINGVIRGRTSVTVRTHSPACVP